MKTSDNNSNQSNANKGIPGTNTQYDKAQGNRGSQLNTGKGGSGKGGGSKGGGSKGGGSKGGGRK